ncbi:DUF3644 domain-containing protein [Thalassospira indica]|uniref:DUF3644 domain-containing protein n=1 Tax=Thalassospira indica TaxID=1891279 RepID=A0ABM6XXJ8_9PROT|nr:DUF3644 domain-containing protein [Thalassospira indica]AXO14410.1 hypothetical protein DY252_09385 [Thalassospira indica]
MVEKKKEGALTPDEKPIVKALLSRGWRNQDIQHLLNRERIATVNSARITEVKKDEAIRPAEDDDVEFFIVKKNSYDPVTGLNFYDDERLIRSREAMILAVQSFNSPVLKFKTEQFAVQSNIAWTYLLHEYFERKLGNIVGRDGRSLLLSQMIKRREFPLSRGIANNIRDMIDVRDKVEHQILRHADKNFFPLFQASCLNFDKSICQLFGERLSLKSELSIALQFTKLDFTQAVELQKFDIPEHIQTLNAELNDRLTEEERSDLDYRFRVIYTLDHTSKSKAHFEFIQPGSDEGKQIHSILEKRVIADDQYPYKPSQAANLIAEKSGRKFTSYNHTQAWRRYKVRPLSNAKDRGQTDKDFCIFHRSHGDYTYNDAWVKFVVERIQSDEEYAELTCMRLR